jgi:hypothetical protein
MTGTALQLRRDSRVAQYLWFAAIVFGLIYWAGALGRSGVAFHEFANWSKLIIVGLKAIATGLLVISAWLVARSGAVQLLTLSLAVIWLADIILAMGYAFLSGFIFAAAHCIAAIGYVKCQPVEKRTLTTVLGALAIPLGGMAIHMYATRGLDVSALELLFPLFSLIVAALAMLSRYPFWPLVVGAITFTISDIAGVVSINMPQGNTLNWLTWLSFFGGLALVVRGIIQWESEIA